MPDLDLPNDNIKATEGETIFYNLKPRSSFSSSFLFDSMAPISPATIEAAVKAVVTNKPQKWFRHHLHPVRTSLARREIAKATHGVKSRKLGRSDSCDW